MNEDFLALQCVENEEQNLSLHLDKREESSLRPLKDEGILPQYQELVSKARKEINEDSHKHCKKMTLDDKFLTETEEDKNDGRWMNLKRLFEEKNRDSDISSTRTSSANQFDKKWRRGAVLICTGSNPACSVSEIRDSEDF